MAGFYGEKVEPGVTDPRLDPLLTVRMQPPDTQARRLDLNTPRVVRVSTSDIVPWATVNWWRVSTFVNHSDVEEWPVEHPISYSAAQRLAQGPQDANTGRAPALPSDEDERPFR